MYILEKKWKKHDLITAVDYRYSSFLFFFLKRGKSATKTSDFSDLGKAREGRQAQLLL